MIDRAITYAAHAHKGMVRKGNKQPYIFHPLEVLNLVSMMTLDDDVLCAAVLHDTVEDTASTLDDIRREFGDRVTNIVGYESENKRVGQNKADTWKERKQEAIDCLSNVEDVGAKMVCLADKVSNLRSFHLLQLQQGDEMWNNFNNHDPKMHYWYYNELAKVLTDLKDYAVYKEYIFLIDAIFSKYLEDK